MVPAIFQVPISAPTASKIKIAPLTEARALPSAALTADQGLPFLRATIAATMALRMSATCTGPSIAPSPNSITEPPINPINTTRGIIASSHEGGRGGVDGAMGNFLETWVTAGRGWGAIAGVGGRLTHATGWGDGG